MTATEPTTVIPVPLSPELAALVLRLAQRDRMPPTAWIAREVAKEVRRRVARTAPELRQRS